MPQIGYPDNMTIGQIIDMIKDIRKSDQVLDEELLHQYLNECLPSACEHYLGQHKK